MNNEKSSTFLVLGKSNTNTDFLAITKINRNHVTNRSLCLDYNYKLNEKLNEKTNLVSRP
jgi:hypothetical protein